MNRAMSDRGHPSAALDLESVFDQHKDAVYRFAWRMTGSPEAAADIAQDVFVTLLRHPVRFDPSRGSMRSFLLAIARNLARKRWREESRWDSLDNDGPMTAPVDVGRGEIADIVGRAVRALPPLQREALILAEYEEMPLRDIALAVDADVGTVKSRLHRARENLRRVLAPLRSTHTAR